MNLSALQTAFRQPNTAIKIQFGQGHSKFFDIKNSLSAARNAYLRTSAINLAKVPVLPLAGYWGLDATGITDMITRHSPMMTRILGEGFGHAGLCFSLHYVVKSANALWSGLTLK